jgi:hypothetical protein
VEHLISNEGTEDLNPGNVRRIEFQLGLAIQTEYTKRPAADRDRTPYEGTIPIIAQFSYRRGRPGGQGDAVEVECHAGNALSWPKRKIWQRPGRLARHRHAPQDIAVGQEDADSDRALVSDSSVAEDEIAYQL